MSDDQNKPSEPKTRPVDTLREGPLKAAIWERKTETSSMFNTTLSRTYQDKEGLFKETGNFRSRDMLGLSELSRNTHARIRELKKERMQERASGAASKEKGQER